jgi:hypothetical protein
MLHCFRAALAKVKVKFHKTYGIELGEIKVVILSLFRKVAYNHAKIEESPANEMLLPTYLNFHNEPISAFVLAKYIKDRTSVESCFSVHFVSGEFHLLDWAFELFRKKGVKQEQKQVFASLAGKGFLESEIQSERSEFVLLVFEAGSASLDFRHNNLLGKNGKQECDIIKGNESASSRNIENKFSKV